MPLYIQFQAKKHELLPYKAKYYDKPEGEDLLGKLLATNRLVIPFGLIVGLSDAFMHQNFTDYQRIAGRVFHWTWPFVGVATAFTTTAYFGAKIRQKDDLYVLCDF